MDIKRWFREHPHSPHMRRMRALTWVKVDGKVIDPLELRFDCKKTGELHSIELAASLFQTVYELRNCGIEIDEETVCKFLEDEMRKDATQICQLHLDLIGNTVDTRERTVKHGIFTGLKVIKPDPISPNWFWTSTDRIFKSGESIIFEGWCVPEETGAT